MMTETKMSTQVQAAQSVRYWLQDKGCYVIATHLLKRRPMIEVSCPPPALLQRAQRITESYSGGTRSVWTVFHDGCQIIWR